MSNAERQKRYRAKHRNAPSVTRVTEQPGTVTGELGCNVTGGIQPEHDPLAVPSADQFDGDNATQAGAAL